MVLPPPPLDHVRLRLSTETARVSPVLLGTLEMLSSWGVPVRLPAADAELSGRAHAAGWTLDAERYTCATADNSRRPRSSYSLTGRMFIAEWTEDVPPDVNLYGTLNRDSLTSARVPASSGRCARWELPMRPNRRYRANKQCGDIAYGCQFNLGVGLNTPSTHWAWLRVRLRRGDLYDGGSTAPRHSRSTWKQA